MAAHGGGAGGLTRTLARTLAIAADPNGPLPLTPSPTPDPGGGAGGGAAQSRCGRDRPVLPRAHAPVTRQVSKHVKDSPWPQAEAEP